MTVVATATFDGGTSGAEVPASSPFTAKSGSFVYTTDARDGGMAGSAGPNVGWLALPVTGMARWRLRTYIKRTGTISGHHFLLTTQDAANAYLGDLQIRNTGGGILYNRYNFTQTSSGIALTAFPTGEWRRVDYEWVNAGTCTCYVYTAADDTVLDYTLTVASPGTAGRVLVGNGNGVSGLAVRFDSLALTDGDDPGPYNPAPPATSPTVRGVIVGGVEVAATIRGVIVAGVEVAATVRSVT